MIDPAFWKGRKVFITGHTGFKGSWLSLWLQQLGAEVTGYALPAATVPNLFEAARVASGMRSIIGDVRDPSALSDALREAAPQVVFHMAAQALVRYSYTHPVETYATNVMGCVHLLEAAHRTPGVTALVNVTSDKCYENREWAWGYRENDAVGGYDPYSSSKACAELVTAAYRNSFSSPTRHREHGMAIATARAGNVIGGGDWAEDRLLPDFVRAIDRDAAIVLRKPAAIRPWQHVLEPLSGYLALAERLCCDGPVYAQAWNFGPDDDSVCSVEAVVRRFAELWGDGARWEVDALTPHPHEATYLKLDCSRAKAQLAWRPRWDLDTALRATAEWYRAHRAGEDAKALVLQQLCTYTAAAL